jgi:gas vesicle protein
MQKRSNKFMIGAIVGGTVGALTTLLFNTNEGKKIQKRLMKKFHEMDEKTGHFGISKFATRYKKTAHRSRKSKSRRAR